MARGTLIRASAVLLLVGALGEPAAGARRRCAALCRAPIADCRAECTNASGRARRQCRATCKRDLLAACRASSDPTCAPPTPPCPGATCAQSPTPTTSSVPTPPPTTTTLPAPPSSMWVSAYYAAWNQDAMPPSEIDFTALTHVIHFAAIPAATGDLDLDGNGLSAERSAAIVAAAHAAGRKVLVSLGGAGSYAAFRSAIDPARRARLVANAVQLVTARGYDGLDVDMEPIEQGDAASYAAFVREVRAALRAADPGLLLTAAVPPEASAVLPAVAADLDQINIMTYDLSGPWPGWETWHNAPLYDGGRRFQSSGAPLPSADGSVNTFIRAGVPGGKIGIGIDFYGVAWFGATGPNQGIADVTVEALAYHEVMDRLYAPDRDRFDAGAQVSYLSIDAEGTANDVFVSYEDEPSCAGKVHYARDRGLGGVILWELTGGYRSRAPAGARNPLLGAVALAAFGG